MLGVDLNADHLAACVLDGSGNPVGEPVSIEVVTAGLAASHGAMGGCARRSPICSITPSSSNCSAVVVENLNFADARATGRETLGRGQRGKRLRRTVAGIPTARFRARLISMAGRRGIAVIGVDAAYTSRWGAQHWRKPLQQQTSDPATVTAITGRRPRSADVASAWRSGGGRRDPAPDSGRAVGTPPARPDHQPGTTSRRCRSSGSPPRPTTTRRAGPPDNTHRQRPTPFGPHRTHSCSVIRNGVLVAAGRTVSSEALLRFDRPDEKLTRAARQAARAADHRRLVETRWIDEHRAELLRVIEALVHQADRYRDPR